MVCYNGCDGVYGVCFLKFVGFVLLVDGVFFFCKGCVWWGSGVGVVFYLGCFVVLGVMG